MDFENQLACANLEYIRGEFRDRETSTVLSTGEAHKLIRQALVIHTTEYYDYLEGSNE